MNKAKTFLYINVIGFVLFFSHFYAIALFLFMFMLVYLIVWFFIDLPTIFGVSNVVHNDHR